MKWVKGLCCFCGLTLIIGLLFILCIATPFSLIFVIPILKYVISGDKKKERKKHNKYDEFDEFDWWQDNQGL